MTINRPPRDGHMAFIRTPGRDFDRAHPEGRRAAAFGALGVDAEHRGVVSRGSRDAWPPKASAAGRFQRDYFGALSQNGRIPDLQGVLWKAQCPP